MNKEAASIVGILLISMLMAFIILLIEVRKRRLNPEYKMQFSNMKIPATFLILILVTPVLHYALICLRELLQSNLGNGMHIFTSIVLTMILFASIYFLFWRLKDRALLDEDKRKLSLEIQRTRALFWASLSSYTFFSAITFEPGGNIFMLGMIAIFFVFLTYELKVRRRQKAQ
ncbi:hypothetical protein K8I31_03660 [bacterium]|nr:hypothetical protein [bacterium]